MYVLQHIWYKIVYNNKGNQIGTGLGLYIVKSIIEEYNNSSISIIKIDDGLTFKITFKANK